MQVQHLVADAGTYGVAIAALLACSPFSLAWHLFLRWFCRRGVGFMPVYSGVLLFVIGWGLLIFGMRAIHPGAPRGWAAAIAVGALGGLAAGWCDRKIVRRFRRDQRLNWNTLGARMPHGALQVRPVPGMALSGRPDPFEQARAKPGRSVLAEEMSLGYVVCVGAMEEMVYRGILIQLCLLLGKGWLVAPAMIGTVLLFGLSHIEFGWPHVFSKIPLGAVALIGVLGTGGILAAVVAHIVFNVQAFAASRSHAAGSV